MIQELASLCVTSFHDLFAGIGEGEFRDPGVFRGRITCDVRDLRPGDVFVAATHPWSLRPGRCAAALSKGAAYVVLPRASPELGSLATDHREQLVVVEDPDWTLAALCSNRFLRSHEHLRLIAVTGTKGKTTVCELIRRALVSADYEAASVSSLGFQFGEESAQTGLTTPQPFELHGLLFAAHERGADFVIVETSSIGIAESRVAGLSFEVAILTNFGKDHGDYHGSNTDYRKVKEEFVRAHGRHKILFGDDPSCRSLAEQILAQGSDLKTYGVESGRDYRATVVSLSPDSMRVEISGTEINSRVPGAHHACNLAGAVAALAALGVSLSDRAAEELGRVALPGRQERIDVGLKARVIVDTAHTPESVAALVRFYSKNSKERPLVVVLGCAGQRDREKRPLMAAVAAKHSDVCILTSDNPRSEDPNRIISDMMNGLRDKGNEPSALVLGEVDRERAIRIGLERALPAGTLLILGRGNESHQELRGLSLPFDDREVVRKHGFEIALARNRTSAPKMTR